MLLIAALAIALACGDDDDDDNDQGGGDANACSEADICDQNAACGFVEDAQDCVDNVETCAVPEDFVDCLCACYGDEPTCGSMEVCLGQCMDSSC
jgi:hypothetical protein